MRLAWGLSFLLVPSKVYSRCLPSYWSPSKVYSRCLPSYWSRAATGRWKYLGHHLQVRASNPLFHLLHWTFVGCLLDVHWMFSGCSLDVHWMFFHTRKTLFTLLQYCHVARNTCRGHRVPIELSDDSVDRHKHLDYCSKNFVF
jgi:hypothetical protein